MYSKRLYSADSYRKKRTIVLRTIVVLIFIYSLGVVIFRENGLLTYYDRMNTLAIAGKNLRELTNQHKHVRLELNSIENDQSSFIIEEHAREYGLSKKGEIVYKFRK